MTSTLPPRIVAAGLDRAIDAFTSELGADASITGAVELLEFRGPYTYRQSDQFDASAAVPPTLRVVELCDFEDHAQLRLGERMKTGLDPNGVLSPGETAVWPAAYHGREL
jgi:hypothetical protein